MPIRTPPAVVRRQTLALTVAVLVPALSGCFGDEDECGPSSSDALRLSIGISEVDRYVFSLWFGCETRDRDWPVERYDFLFAFPESHAARFHFATSDLAPADGGSVVVEIPGETAPSAYHIRFEGWGPTNDDKRAPKVITEWDRHADGTFDDRPGGWYNLTVSLHEHPTQDITFSHCWCPGR